MKRGSSLRRHVRLARVSATVRRQRPEFDAVYRVVDARSGGRCEVRFSQPTREAFPETSVAAWWPCLARAQDHHHCVKPRRSHTTPELVIHLCRRHHDQCSASYRLGRLVITPGGDGSFTCAVVQKASKWA